MLFHKMVCLTEALATWFSFSVLVSSHPREIGFHVRTEALMKIIPHLGGEFKMVMSLQRDLPPKPSSFPTSHPVGQKRDGHPH
jgi:hypothetical protein